MAVSVNPSRRSSNSRKLAVDSEEASPFNPRNPKYRPARSNDSYNNRGESFIDMLNDKFGPHDSLPRQLEVAGNEYQNFMGDAVSGGANLLRWLTGGSPVDSRNGAYDTYRRNPTPKSPDRRGFSGRDFNRKAEMAEQSGSGSGEKTFQDYLDEASGYVTQEALPDYEALRRRLQEEAGQSDARLEAMYRALGGERDKLAGDLNQTYDKSGEAIDQSSSEAAAQIAAGYQEAQQQKFSEMARLGITEGIGDRSEQATADQAAAVARTAERGDIAGTANEQNRAGSVAYSTDMRGVGDMQGVEARSAIQSRLQDELAGLTFEESKERARTESQYRKERMDTAMQMLQNSQGGGLSPEAAAEEQRRLAEFLREGQWRAEDQQFSQQEELGRIYEWAFEASGGDAEKAMKLYQERLAAMGLG